MQIFTVNTKEETFFFFSLVFNREKPHLTKVGQTEIEQQCGFQTMSIEMGLPEQTWMYLHSVL